MSSRPLAHNYATAAGQFGPQQLLDHEAVRAKAIHSIAADGINPEQAVDEAIARIKPSAGLDFDLDVGGMGTARSAMPLGRRPEGVLGVGRCRKRGMMAVSHREGPQ